ARGWRFVRDAVVSSRGGTPVPRIRRHDERVAHESGTVRPREGRAPETLGEPAIVERHRFLERRLRHAATGPERLASSRRRPPIPRADLLADVASEEMGADCLSHLLWDGPAQLDREIGEAAPRVHDPGSPDGLGWARFYSGR